MANNKLRWMTVRESFEKTIFASKPTVQKDVGSRSVLEFIRRKRLPLMILGGGHVSSSLKTGQAIIAKYEEITIIDEWCWGFMHAVHMCFDDWVPLIESDEHRHLMSPMFLHGTEPGWEELENDPKFTEVSHGEWVAMIPSAVKEVYEFWLPYRRGEMRLKAVKPDKVGRNTPCPCGSGKKFKKCCGAPDRLH